jgi:hypothetical protein
MRRMFYVFCAVVFMASCTREGMEPQPLLLPVLKYTIQRDSAERIMRASHYNEFKLVTFDTIYQAGTSNIGMTYMNTYNSKGKRLRSENFIPILYTGGFYWAWQDHYKDDTIPLVTYRYLKGNQVAEITHIYNGAGKLIIDSTYHTPNYGTFTYLSKYEYDANGRLSSALELNDTRDTTSYTTYQYSANKVEKLTMRIDYFIPMRSYGRNVTEYNASGKILSEKGYMVPGTEVYSQVDYTYDAAGNLLKKISTSVSSPSQEERYFINAGTGVTEKMEYYYDNKLRNITTYYYE